MIANMVAHIRMHNSLRGYCLWIHFLPRRLNHPTWKECEVVLDSIGWGASSLAHHGSLVEIRFAMWKHDFVSVCGRQHFAVQNQSLLAHILKRTFQSNMPSVCGRAFLAYEAELVVKSVKELKGQF